MTPTISPFPIAVTRPLPVEELESVAEGMRKDQIPYVIVRDGYKFPKAETEATKQELCSLWRAEIPNDKEFAGRQSPLFSFLQYIKRGKESGPKPGTATWDGKIVETWKP